MRSDGICNKFREFIFCNRFLTISTREYTHTWGVIRSTFLMIRRRVSKTPSLRVQKFVFLNNGFKTFSSEISKVVHAK